MLIRQTHIKVIQADITELSCEAIVNAANNQLLMGGGVAGVIRKKGGQAIEDEAVKKAPIAIGEAVWTKGGNLKAQYVIHAATMGMDFKTDEHKIRASCASALNAAEELKISSIALPALGCGVGQFPYIGSAKIMAQAILKHLIDNPKTLLREINICLYDQAAFEIFHKNVTSYINYSTNPERVFGPYPTVDIIIELPQGIVLIERLNPPFGWAIPGGFLDNEESLEDAARREAKEETNMDLEDLRQFHTYSDPKRDPRFHTVSTVFIATGKGTPLAGDDAQAFKIVPYKDLPNLEFAFDHGKIIADYLKARQGR